MNYCYYIVFGRTPFSTPVYMKTKKPACSNSSGLESVFEELRFPSLVSDFISIDDRSNNRRNITAF